MKERYPGGFRQVVPNAIDVIAFEPRFSFSVAADALIEPLADAGHDTTYLTCA